MSGVAAVNLTPMDFGSYKTGKAFFKQEKLDAFTGPKTKNLNIDNANPLGTLYDKMLIKSPQ